MSKSRIFSILILIDLYSVDGAAQFLFLPPLLAATFVAVPSLQCLAFYPFVCFLNVVILKESLTFFSYSTCLLWLP